MKLSLRNKKTIFFGLMILFSFFFVSQANINTAENLKAQTIETESSPKVLGEVSNDVTKSRTKSREDKLVAITIDDGYGDIEPFLDVLKSQRVNATFFMLGTVVDSNPEAMKKIVEDGHLLSSHSYSHPEFPYLSKDEVRSQLQSTRDSIIAATGFDPYPYFRYPYGSHSVSSDQVLAEEGWEYFYWTQNTWDWKYHEDTEEGRQFIYDQAINNPPDESIILLHTMSKSSLGILPDIIKWYRQKGYTFVTVDEL